MACFENTDCKDPAKPFCSYELSCTECQEDANCKDPAKPVCQAPGVCATSCRSDADCAAGLSCDTDSGRCQ